MEILGLSHYFWSGIGLVTGIILAAWSWRLCRILNRIDITFGAWLTAASGGRICAILPTIAFSILIHIGILSLREPWMIQDKKEFIVVMYIFWMFFLFLSLILLLFSQTREIPRRRGKLIRFSKVDF